MGQAAELEARLEALLLTQSTNSVGYRIGVAAKEFRPFEGKEDGTAYILELTHLLGTHEVWSRRSSWRCSAASSRSSLRWSVKSSRSVTTSDGRGGYCRGEWVPISGELPSRG
jgi:hypothetical protein